MQSPNDPRREQDLRVRAAVRVARKRPFTVSAGILGSLIVLILLIYSSTTSATFLIPGAIFAAILALRAWIAFGTNDAEARIRPGASAG
jgi:hypothetical protein